MTAQKFALGAIVLMALMCVACTGHADIYNLTSGEKTTLAYNFGLIGNGHGTIEGTFASGEKATGEWSAVSSAVIGWGSVFGEVYGTHGSASGSATSITMAESGTRKGAAILTGASGTVVNCEFAINDSRHGYGACRGNDGTLYRLIF